VDDNSHSKSFLYDLLYIHIHTVNNCQNIKNGILCMKLNTISHNYTTHLLIFTSNKCHTKNVKKEKNYIYNYIFLTKVYLYFTNKCGKYSLPLRYNEGSVNVPSIPSSGMVQILIFASSHANKPSNGSECKQTIYSVHSSKIRHKLKIAPEVRRPTFH